MTQFNVYYDDDIEIVVDKFLRALKDFANVTLDYDDDGAMEIEITPKITDTAEYINIFFDAYERTYQQLSEGAPTMLLASM